MNTGTAKWERVFAVVAVALQIPFLWLWRITYDAVRLSAHRLEMMDDGRIELVFKWELLGVALLDYLPVILPLVVCLVLSVMGVVSALRRKTAPTPVGLWDVCRHAVALVAVGVLVYSFSLDYIWWEQGMMNRLYLCEFTLYRNLGSDFVRGIPLLMSLKFIFLGLYGLVCAALCGLGIADVVRIRRTPPKYGDDR